MLSRLKKIAKRAAAVIATGIITLTALPAIPVHASGGVINYHVYQNAKQLYDSVADTSWIYTTPDNSELFWVTKSNKASSSSHLKYRTLGWRLVMSGSGYSQKCDLILDSTIRKPAGALGECESNGYYYILYTIDLKTVYNRMCAQNSGVAAAIYGGSSYHITAHPIMTKVPANSSPSGSLTGENSNGTVNTSGFVCFMDEDNGYNALKNCASWSSASYDAFSDFHSGRNCDINAMKYNVRYKIVDGNGNAVKDTSLSSGLKTNSGGGVVNSSGSAYSQNVTSFAPISALNVAITKPGYTLETVWKKSGTNYAVGFGGQITSYAIGGNTTLVAKVTPNTYYVDYYKDGNVIMRQTCTYDKNFSTYDGTSVSWDNYVFKNWNTQENGKGTIYNSKQTVKNLTTVPGGVVKLYAQKEPKEYEVTLNPVGGSGGTDKVYEKYGIRYTAQSEKVVNNPASISAVTSPKKFGYDFTGYFTSANGEGNKFADGVNPLMQTPNANHTVAITKDTVMFNAKNTHTVYANYTPRTPVISFNKQGGLGGSDSTTATFGSDLPLVDNNKNSLSAPSKEGWSFKGYYTEPDGRGTMFYNESMGATKTCDFEDNLTVYAYWVDNIPPTVTVVPTTNGWTNQAINITIRMRDTGSGLKKSGCVIKMDGKEIGWNRWFSDGCTDEVVTTITCTTEGIHKYEAIATDMWGNVSSAMTVVYYDITAPKGSVHAYGPGVSERIPMTYLNNSSVWYIRDGKVTDYNVKYD